MVENRDIQGWEILGRPQGGTVSALAIAQDNEMTVFVGAGAGLYRSRGPVGAGLAKKGELPEWERLPEAPLGIMSLAVSPNYAHDHTLVAGTVAGIFISRDGGETWLVAKIPLSSSMVLALGFSPGFASDGMLLAGTLEDGVFASDTRGEHWSSQSFGLLDASVFSLALSPGFKGDGTAFAGTDSALYFTYNHGRAWKALPFPEEAAPVLSLAVSPGFPDDRMLYAGTEQGGLYRSSDGGQSWQPLELPANSVNALLAPQKDTILAATEGGVFQSNDRGETWDCLLNLPDALSLAAQGELILAGVVDQGVWIGEEGAGWQPAANLATRSLVGLLLSSRFEQDGLAFLWGGGEGIWRTADGGGSWEDLSEGLPGLEIHSLALSPAFPRDRTLAAACGEGLLLSQDGGETWQTPAQAAASAVCFSPDGKLLVAAVAGGGVRLTTDQGQTWRQAPGPWETAGKVIGLAATNGGHLFAAHLEGDGETVGVWQGQPENMEKVLSQPAGATPVASFWIPGEAAANRPWYASLGNKVWKFSARAGQPAAESTVFPPEQGENILSFTGAQGPEGMRLFACTSRQLYHSANGQKWAVAHDFGSQRVMSIALSPGYLENQRVYAVLLGGSFCRGKIR